MWKLRQVFMFLKYIKRLKQYNETRGIIVFTDPDSPGEAIRNKIINYVGTCKHASLSTKQSRGGKKLELNMHIVVI